MTKFKVFEADVWTDSDSYNVNMYYPLIDRYTVEQLVIELSNDTDDINIINSLIDNNIISSSVLNQDDYKIDIDYLYSDIIITIIDINDIESLPTIIKLCEV